MLRVVILSLSKFTLSVILGLGCVNFAASASAEVICKQEAESRLRYPQGVTFYSGDPSEGASLAPGDMIEEDGTKYQLWEFRPGGEPYPINLVCRYENGNDLKVVLPSQTKTCRYDDKGVTCISE